MADNFLAEIRIFPYTFAPKGWAFCSGQLLPISQNTALFSLLGTTYGGDGKSTFALPNLRDSVPMHPGQGPGLTLRDLGETGGAGTTTLLVSEIPAHTHALQGTSEDGDSINPSGAYFARGTNMYSTTPAGSLSNTALSPAGGGQPHNNLQPYLVLNFCIALQGIFPPRS